MKMYNCNFFYALVVVFALSVLAQGLDQSGFLSIDCGMPKSSSYIDETTDLKYVSDATFIESGINKNISAKFQTSSLAKQFYNVRSFPEGMKNCYNLNPAQGKGSKYLIRASFMYGNYDSENKPPAFDLYLGVNLWDSVIFDNVSATIIVKEIIHITTSNDLYVCLMNTGLGTPFISVLELRVLRNSTYISQYQSLVLYRRLDLGSTTNQTVRFKDDVYDRIWKPHNFLNFKILSTSFPIDANDSNDFQLPSFVMGTATTPVNASTALTVFWEQKDPNLKHYVYMHFAEVEELQVNEFREFNISQNDEFWLGSVTPKYLHTSTVSTTVPVSGNRIEFSLYRTQKSTHPPIINALEVFIVKDLLQSPTEQIDVDAMTNIKSKYGVKRNWQGDPCAPKVYSWERLTCSHEGHDPPRIISLNLSSSGLSGEISLFLSNLTSIQHLDLSNNSLTGTVPEFLSRLPFLKVLNLKGNNLTGSIPVKLLERSKNGSLLLSVDENSNLCSSISCHKKEKSKFVFPLAASAGAVFILLISFAIWWNLRKRTKQDFGDRNESLEIKIQRFTYSEVSQMTENFKRPIGEGGFGKVYHGYLDDSTQVAVKMLSLTSKQGYKEFQAEVELLMRVHHRNLTTLVGYCNEDSHMALVYEYMANGSLKQYLSDRSEIILSWDDRLRIAIDAAQGLEYLHEGIKPAIVHRDIKPENILLNEKFEAKLADFGLSKIFPIDGGTHVSTVIAGTIGYLDPQYYETIRLNEKSDVYSFGVVLLEIITSRGFAIKKNENECTHISKWVAEVFAKGDIKNIVDQRLKEDFETASAGRAVELALACASHSSSERPKMNEIVIELKECLVKELTRRITSCGTEGIEKPREMDSLN